MRDPCNTIRYNVFGTLSKTVETSVSITIKNNSKYEKHAIAQCATVSNDFAKYHYLFIYTNIMKRKVSKYAPKNLESPKSDTLSKLTTTD